MSISGVKFQTLSFKLRTILLKTVRRFSNFQFVLIFLKHKGIWGLGVKFQTSTSPNQPRECNQEIFRKLMGTCLQRYYCGVSSPCVLLVAPRFCNFSWSPQVVAFACREGTRAFVHRLSKGAVTLLRSQLQRCCELWSFGDRM